MHVQNRKSSLSYFFSVFPRANSTSYEPASTALSSRSHTGRVSSKTLKLEPHRTGTMSGKKQRRVLFHTFFKTGVLYHRILDDVL